MRARLEGEHVTLHRSAAPLVSLLSCAAELLSSSLTSTHVCASCQFCDSSMYLQPAFLTVASRRSASVFIEPPATLSQHAQLPRLRLHLSNVDYQDNISRARLSAIIADTQACYKAMLSYVQPQNCLPRVLGASLQILSCKPSCSCNVNSNVSAHQQEVLWQKVCGAVPEAALPHSGRLSRVSFQNACRRAKHRITSREDVDQCCHVC